MVIRDLETYIREKEGKDTVDLTGMVPSNSALYSTAVVKISILFNMRRIPLFRVFTCVYLKKICKYS